MPLPLVYHEDYSPPFPAGHRFPMEKFRLLRDHLVASGLTTDAELLRPELCPAEILALVRATQEGGTEGLSAPSTWSPRVGLGM